MTKSCLIIYNPKSGKGINEKVLKSYYEILNKENFNVDLIMTEYSEHATKVIKEANYYDIVFSIGGDGTLNEVIKGNFQRKDKLTICPLPSGTCNDVASMLGYGKNPINNLKMALDGNVNEVDIGLINDNPFIYVAGMGKFMNISYDTDKTEKQKYGYKAYLKESIGEFFNNTKRYKAEIIVDGKKIEGSYSLIMISNSNHIAGINNFYKDVYLNDGKMEVLLCNSKTKINFLSNFFKFFNGYNTEDIVLLKAQNVNIKILEQLDKKWCVDGEKYNYNGNEYNISIQDKMKFLIPNKKVKKLFKS